MIDVNAACELVIQMRPSERIGNITDIGHSYVLGLVNVNGETPDVSPFMVNKQTGSISVFFPPKHKEELKRGKHIETPEEYGPINN